jgi:hypothetical protein
MKINGVNTPDADNRGRAFRYKEDGPHFCGPCLMNGVLMVVKVWENSSVMGNKYLRMVFETPEDNQHLIQD